MKLYQNRMKKQNKTKKKQKKKTKKNWSMFENFSDASMDAAILKKKNTDITKTRLFKYTKNFTTKNGKFQIKNSDIFHISAQNIDCGYSVRNASARRF